MHIFYSIKNYLDILVWYILYCIPIGIIHFVCVDITYGRHVSLDISYHTLLQDLQPSVVTQWQTGVDNRKYLSTTNNFPFSIVVHRR